jgi:phospholipid/cholesterol/gamma-HCH transport system substrate-binding protein
MDLSAAQRLRYLVTGVAFIAVVLAAVVACFLDYANVFTSSVDATVRSDRSGLLLDPGADVTVRGVVVGRVRSVHSDGYGATIDIAVEPGMTHLVPADVTANITAPTVFGAKYVDLVLPADGGTSSAPLRSGDVIEPATVSIEVNDVFSDALQLLDTVQPAKVGVILGTMSDALDGQGATLGDTLRETNTLSVSLDHHLTALTDDMRELAPVSGEYADAAPALLQVIHNLGITSVTLAQTAPQLTSSLTSISTAAAAGQSLLAANGPSLEQALTTLRPTARLLAQYAPTLPCILADANNARVATTPALGGDYPGLYILAAFEPTAAPYSATSNASVLDTVDGPDCLGAPLAKSSLDGAPVAKGAQGQVFTPYPHITLRDGTATSFPKGSNEIAAGGVSGVAGSAASLDQILANLLGGTP